jgi:streptogramin lyase
MAIALALIGDMAIVSQAPAIAPPGIVEEFPVRIDFLYFGLEAITPDPQGDIWYTEHGEGTVGYVAPSGLITEFRVPPVPGPTNPESYYGPEYIRYLEGIARDAKGNMWFTDHGNYNEEASFIGRIAPGGTVSRFTIPTSQVKGSYPGGIALGSDGNMWFTDPESNGDRGGDLLEEVSAPEKSSIGRISPQGAISNFAIPPTDRLSGGIALGSDSNMWFTAYEIKEENYLPKVTGRSFIGRITPSGAVSEFQLPGNERLPGGIALGSDGNMWFTEPGSNTIGRITPAGDISEFSAPEAGGEIVPGPDGNMWFTEESNAIGRITSTGEVISFGPISNYGESIVGIAAGTPGEIWFTENSYGLPGGFTVAHLGRLIMRPVNNELPAISGEASEGQVLAVSSGQWSNSPSTIGYQWQLCDASGGGCVNLTGDVAATHLVTAGELGHTLRVLVTASNASGSTSAASALSRIVRTAPVAPVPIPLVVKKPFRVVSATMTWSFGWFHTYTVVESLMVHGLPGAGGFIEVACHGRGCPFTQQRFAPIVGRPSCHGSKCTAKHRVQPQRDLSLTRLLKNRHLGVGTSISVRVVKTGWIGRSFLFTMRASRSPLVQFACLDPGSIKTARRC